MKQRRQPSKTTAPDKKMLAILGSPHKKGSSALMLEQAISAGEAKGWHIDRIDLYDMNIAYCTGCRKCLQTGACVRKDDAARIAELLKACDMVVLSCPSYWANVPAIVKNMFDRLLGTVMQETATFPKPRLSGNQRFLLLGSCKTPFPFSFLFGQKNGLLHAAKEFFHYAGMKSAGSVTCSGMDSTKISAPHKSVSERKLARIRRCIGKNS